VSQREQQGRGENREEGGRTTKCTLKASLIKDRDDSGTTGIRRKKVNSAEEVTPVE